MDQPACQKMFETVFPFWNHLSGAEQAAFCDNTASRTYLKGENVHGGSGECTGAILVRRGCLRAYLLSEDGREITLYRLYEGDICMLSASCVLQAITFDVFVDAEQDSDCFLLNGAAFLQLAQQNLRVENYVLHMAVNRFSDVMWVMQQILFMSYDKRLAIFLLDEMNRTGEPVIHLTQEQIAKYTGSAREVVSRMLKHFAAEGIAEAARGGVKITDKEKLRALAL